MIPYIEFRTIPLGFIDIQVWGLMVALGILIGARASEWMVKRRGLDPKMVWESLVWILIGAFVFARLFHIVFYEPLSYIQNPGEIIAIWHGGMSISGGFIGAVAGAVFYFRKRKVDIWKYSDAMMFGLPLGLFIGRIGCFLIHDHPGTATDFVLGVKYPDGVTRHDHGLYLSLNGLCLFLVFLWMAKKQVREGMFLAVFLIWYGVVRFGLDFLRATDGDIVDSRYLGLTPAQYFSVVMVLFGLFIWRRFRK